MKDTGSYTVNKLNLRDIEVFMERFELVRDWLRRAEDQVNAGAAKGIIGATIREVANIESYISKFIEGIKETSGR